MKIKKEFIPLILNYKKTFEFRIHGQIETKEGIYKVGEKYFKLIKQIAIDKKHLDRFEIDNEEDFFEELCGLLAWYGQIDIESEKFIRENNYYQRVLEGEILFCYEWKEVTYCGELIGV